MTEDAQPHAAPPEPEAPGVSAVPTDAAPETAAPLAGLSRRGLLGLLGAGAGGLVVGGLGGAAIAAAAASGPSSAGAGTVHPFFGGHQAGITTPVQDHLHFAAFDMADDAARDDLVSLLQDWSYAASRMTQGLDVSASGAVGGSPQAPPDDTGEALGLPASALTITFGFGPSLFEKGGKDRFGIAARRPDVLVDLPRFLGDDLVPLGTGGDLCVQACADDPQVAFHAVRNLARIGRGTVVLRWTQLGFGRASATNPNQETPRNLLGFKDGTANIDTTDDATMARHVWVGREEPQAWMRGGSYVVTRRIRMRIEGWDRDSLGDQERTIGRAKVSGAPLTGGTEHTPLKLGAKDAQGQPLIDARAHVRLAHPTQNGGIQILRRGYNFTDGTDYETGQLDAGLFFIAYQRDPHRQFVVLQNRLGANDLLNEYILHTSSGLFAVPPGTRPGEYVGQSLLA